MKKPRSGQWLFKRWAFYLLRCRQSVRLVDDEQVESGRRLRVLQVGNEDRARDYLERLYGKVPKSQDYGRGILLPLPERRLLPKVERDLELIEINRLHVPRFRQAGYFAIPQWVEFGCEVVRHRGERYAAADQWLRQRIQSVEEAGFEPRFSKSPDDFDLFFRQMYLPYTHSRFGDASITKTAAKLRKDFESGFAMLLEHEGAPVAGGVARIDGESLCLKAIGVADGDQRLLKLGVSAALDFHIHEWAAANGMRFIDVGHTRPFPADGVFFNKRKWLMSIRPDADGVMNMALRWGYSDQPMIRFLGEYTFIFQTAEGLGVFLIHSLDHAMDYDEAGKMLRRNWLSGLSSLIAVCPNGLREGVMNRICANYGDRIHVCRDLDSARKIHRSLP